MIVHSSEESGTLCGNERHPSGNWHPSAPLPSTFLGAIRQLIRRVRWGCGCAR